MFERVTPESMGISSKKIKEYIEVLEAEGLSTHDIIIARGGKILFDAYWKPFHRDFLHRMYSVTKSVVALAVGFAEQDGLLNLDDKISKYFAKELKNQPDKNMHNQTIRDMLMMSTAKPDRSWFAARCEDRVQFYFDNEAEKSKPSGTIFEYDSTGSFVLGALVERLTKKTLMDYLREKFLDEIGVSQDAYMLKCPGGHSWSDSALICKPEDLLKIAQFTMNYGKWNGRQILNEKFVKEATSALITNNEWGDSQHNSLGYGYLIWRTHRNSFFFNGMGCQFAICTPHKDLIFIYNSDNQGKQYAKKVIIDNYFKIIVDNCEDNPLTENCAAQKDLEDYCKTLVLAYAKGKKHTEFEKKVNGVTYKLNKNPMGIKELTLTVNENDGVLSYINEQGKKELKFGLCHNEFVKFPQDGYSDETGTKCGNIRYDSAVSAAWIDERKLYIKVQAIDKYFGVLNIFLSYTEDGILGVQMVKSAEDFFNEYAGYASGSPVE